ncbi:MAG: CvpA family protein [Oscillospiraceae bacterium]|nr:CvpA family protein [Oscillospiraceae bacterium]MDD4413697.1 CvpA family protein [Oscillospiraceae bacterium]
MSFILDGLIVVIFLVAILLGYKRGFFKSAIQLVGCIAAALIAFSLSAPIASGIYNQFISPSVEKKISAEIEKAGSESIETALNGVLDNLPDSLTNALTVFNLGSPDQIKERLPNSLDGTASQVSAIIEEKVVRPAAVSLLRLLCFFILFIILMIVVGILATIGGRLFRVPVLRQVDGLLGGVLGAAQGVVFVFVAVTIMSLIAASSKNDDKLTRAVMNDTVIVHSLEKVNPITDTLNNMFDAKSV